jgi:hypothetical protein
MSTDSALLVLVAITGFSALFQLIVLIAIFVFVRKAMKAAEQKTEEIRTVVMPIITNTRDLIARVEPKLDAAASDLAEVTHALHAQAIKVQASADEVVGRVNRQVVRVDHMATTVLDKVEQVGVILNEAVKVPLRQVSGLVAAAKAMVDTFRAPTPPRRVNPTVITDDKDLLV